MVSIALTVSYQPAVILTYEDFPSRLLARKIGGGDVVHRVLVEQRKNPRRCPARAAEVTIFDSGLDAGEGGFLCPFDECEKSSKPIGWIEIVRIERHRNDLLAVITVDDGLA